MQGMGWESGESGWECGECGECGEWGRNARNLGSNVGYWMGMWGIWVGI